MRQSPALFAALLSLISTAACVEDDACDSEETCHDDTALFEKAYDEGQQPGKQDGTDCSGVRVPDRSGFGKRVALTFDDGPNPATTPKVIEVLKRHHAPAAFFTNGSKYSVAGAKELAASIAADPDFILANHSQRHLDLAKQTAATVATEIDRTDALIREAHATPKYFRFPFGSSTCGSMKQARDRGYLVTGWHVDSADWCFAVTGGERCPTATFKHVPDSMRNDMQGYVTSQVRANNGGIVLFHDIHQSTADHLDGILTALEQQGYTFVRLDDTRVFPRLHGITPPFIGTPCMNDNQCSGFLGGRCHAAGFCTQSCAGSCPDAGGAAATFCMADPMSESGVSGICVSKAAVQNNQCALLPRTVKKDVSRFVGQSGAAAATATVCSPR